MLTTLHRCHLGQAARLAQGLGLQDEALADVIRGALAKR